MISIILNNKKYLYFLLFLVLSYSCKKRTIISYPNQVPEKNSIKIAESRHVDIFLLNGSHLGGGIFLDNDGFILTERSILPSKFRELKISIDGKNFQKVKKFFFLKEDNLVIISSDLKVNLLPMKISDNSEISILSDIFTVTSPYGLKFSFIQGFISNTNRKGLDPLFPDIPYFQVTTLNYEGTSGSGVYSINGTFLGINRKSGVTGQENGFGLVIPAKFIMESLKKLKITNIPIENKN
ncbi:MAG: serine protease [Leptospiraceae bacterium]|nr:serine protease [Leptospiraceae bacterium]